MPKRNPKRKPKYNRKKRTHHQAHMEQRLKKIVMATILIPLFLLTAFVFFGPKIGSIFGFISADRYRPDSDTLAPTIPIFTNAPKTTKERNIKLEGFAEAGSTVRLFVNGPEAQTTTTTNDGTFTFEGVELNAGKNTIFAKAYDQNGNESEKSRTVSIVIDDNAPEIEIESPKDGETIKNLNKRVVVKGKINEKVTIKVNGKFAVQRPDQTFEIVLGVDEGFVKITVEATDEAGNSTSEELTIKYEKGGQ